MSVIGSPLLVGGGSGVDDATKVNITFNVAPTVVTQVTFMNNDGVTSATCRIAAMTLTGYVYLTKTGTYTVTATNSSDTYNPATITVSALGGEVSCNITKLSVTKYTWDHTFTIQDEDSSQDNAVTIYPGIYCDDSSEENPRWSCSGGGSSLVANNYGFNLKGYTLANPTAEAVKFYSGYVTDYLHFRLYKFDVPLVGSVTELTPENAVALAETGSSDPVDNLSGIIPGRVEISNNGSIVTIVYYKDTSSGQGV